MTTKAALTGHFPAIVRCLHCKTVVRDEVAEFRAINFGSIPAGVKGEFRPWYRECPTCHLSLDVALIVGEPSETPCGQSCQEAKGAVCICSCLGKSHGKAWLK